MPGFRFAIITISLFLPFYAGAEPICVTQNRVDLRKGPGMKHPVSWAVARNMPLLKVSEKKDEKKRRWFQVQDLDGETHWVLASAVSRRVNCAVIRSKQARLRRGPGKGFPAAELISVDRYTPFRRLERDGEWLLLQDDYQGRYWVHETNVWIPVIRSKVAF
jgi:SH3-like domain-containing protein